MCEKYLFAYLSLLKGKKITEKTLLIFDEVQECPNIISALKYFCQDHRDILVIATGSMVRIKIQRITNKRGGGEKFLFPVGKIDQITVYPMTFDEFLMNSNRISQFKNGLKISPKLKAQPIFNPFLFYSIIISYPKY